MSVRWDVTPSGSRHQASLFEPRRLGCLLDGPCLPLPLGLRIGARLRLAILPVPLLLLAATLSALKCNHVRPNHVSVTMCE